MCDSYQNSQILQYCTLLLNMYCVSLHSLVICCASLFIWISNSIGLLISFMTAHHLLPLLVFWCWVGPFHSHLYSLVGLCR